MRRGLFVAILGLMLTVPAYGQFDGGGEFRIFYQTIQGFDYDAGGGFVVAEGGSFHGGGFGFVFDLNDWFGIYSDTSFLGGLDSDFVGIKLITQNQGAKLTARDIAGANLYGKAGIGIQRFVIELSGTEGVSYQTGFDLGGGVDVPLSEGLYWFGELKMSLLSLPDLTGAPGRDKWSKSPTFSTGILFRF